MKYIQLIKPNKASCKKNGAQNIELPIFADPGLRASMASRGMRSWRGFSGKAFCLISKAISRICAPFALIHWHHPGPHHGPNRTQCWGLCLPLEREAAAMPRLNLGLKEGSTKAEINDMSCELHCMPRFLVHSCSCLHSVEMRTPQGQPECRSRRTWLKLSRNTSQQTVNQYIQRWDFWLTSHWNTCTNQHQGGHYYYLKCCYFFLCESSCLHFSSGELVRTRDVLPVTEG